MRVRRTSQRLSHLLENSRQPVYVLDTQRRIIFANSALTNWLQTPPEKLLGVPCNYHSRADASLIQRIAASLCPPPEVFRGAACRAEVGGYLLEESEGRSSPSAPAQFVPLSADADGYVVVAFVGLSKDVPDRELLSPNDESDHRELHQQVARWRREIADRYRLDRIVAFSAAARAVQRMAKAAIDSGADTLIVGPPGGGMEQLARSIHYSQYDAGTAPPLVPLDCAICDAESLQSALRQVQSDRERSIKGRLLLLHADRMNGELMNELAGFVAMPGFDVGFLSTAERPLREIAERGQMAKSLAHYLGVIEITLPPLRDRLQDLPLLCQSLIEDFNAEGNRQLAGIAADALELLREYPWPGDWDELTQVIQLACRNAQGSFVQLSDLPPRIHQGVAASRIPRKPETTIELAAFLREVEDELMRRAIRVSKGNKAKAARMLGVSRQRIIRWSEQNKPTS